MFAWLNKALFARCCFIIKCTVCDRTGNTYLIGCWCVSVWGARDRIQFILDDGIFCEHTHFMVWPHFLAFLIGNRHIWRNFLIKFIYFFDPSAILFTFCLSVQCSLVRHSLLLLNMSTAHTYEVCLSNENMKGRKNWENLKRSRNFNHKHCGSAFDEWSGKRNV